MMSPDSSVEMADLKSEAINVVVRCRGRNEQEISLKSDIVINVPDKTGSREVSINTSNDNSIVGKIAAKTFSVDQVFGPGANQELIFNNVALPLFEEFLKGFNCTIFAYGQTGTGKTHTMCGDDRSVNGSYSPNLGIIPRLLFKLFENLDNNTKLNRDYVIKCSLVEIYNETLKDLLNPKSKKELRIYEEQIKTIPGKPDKTAVFIKNLEEVCIKDAMDGLALLHKGSIDRKTASTNMNKSSSRSHTLFSISLYKKDQDDYYRYSKMNLVDLAGSENISRSGLTDLQAKEAGSINKSLLSLGKVINALVDNNLPPYRDSKLTRLLKDSLGGETKTVLIANISPSSLDSDETAKTLEYASKAKNVMNTPQVGNLMLKHVVVRDLVEEVSKMRKDLTSCWAKDGIMMDKDNYEQLKKDLQHYKIQVEEINRKLEFQQNQNKLLDHDLNLKIKEANSSRDKLKELNQVNNILNGKLQKQQNSERMLYDSTKKYKELINLFDLGIEDFDEHQRKINLFLKHKIHDNLQLQSQKLVDMIEKNLKFDQDVDVNIGKIKNIASETIEGFQVSAFQICDNATNSLTKKMPQYFDNLKQEICQLSELTKEDLSNLSKNLDSVNENNSKLNKYLSQSLFNNHDELLKRHIELIKLQTENSKKEFINNMCQIIDKQYDDAMTKIPLQINDLCKQIVDSEKDLLAGTKYDWLQSTSSKMQDSQKMIESLQTNLQKNSSTVNDSIDQLASLTSDSKSIFEDERRKIVEMIKNLKNDTQLETQLGAITNKIDSMTNLKNTSMNEAITIVDTISNTCELVNEKSKTKFSLSQREKISQLINTINNNQRVIDSNITVPKSRSASPIRSAPISRHPSPLRSVSRSGSRVPSRALSRSNSRLNSPRRDSDDKENMLKRSSDDLESVDQVPKKIKYVTNDKVKMIKNSIRKPFR